MHADAPANGSSSCRCTRCATDLTSVSALARFCPRCGIRLSDHRPKLHPAGGLFASCILRGYANAMFRLGAHHEFRHNDDEAVRCYDKASRLGNASAKARLLDIPLAAALDYAPDPLPPET